MMFLFREGKKRDSYICSSRNLLGSFIISFLIAILILGGITASLGPSYVYADTAGTINSSEVNFRSGPSKSTDVLAVFPYGAKVTVLDSSENWYKVVYNGKTGYVYGEYVTISGNSSGGSGETNSSFEKELALFPESYKPYLRMLHALHPAWHFNAQATALDWNTVISKETLSNSTNVVPRTYSSAYKKYASQASVDSGGWVTASKAAVEYYMDPRNFLNESSIFQFYSMKYDAKTQTIAGVKSVIGSSFMSSPIPKNNAKGAAEKYTDYPTLLMAAGKASGVNPMVLASMIIQELGSHPNQTTGYVSGNVKGYEGYYNYYNIEAYASGGRSALTNGLIAAKKRGWNSRTNAVMGGAEFFGSNYVRRGQHTLYLKKFNVMNGATNVATHQYMTNVAGADSEGKHLKSGYNSVINSALSFDIPIYLNMPANACPKPGSSASSGSDVDDSTVKASLTRLDGADRYKTGEKVASQLKSSLSVSRFQNIVLASGTDYADALSGAYLAKIKNAPIILVNSGKTASSGARINDSDVSFRSTPDRSGYDNVITYLSTGTSVTVLGTSGEWYRVKYNGNTGYVFKQYVTVTTSSNSGNNISSVASYVRSNLASGGTVYILGGTSAIPSSMEGSLSGLKTVRLKGGDRYGTNIAILKECKVNKEDIMVCSGRNFADALSASACGKPVLLVNKSLSSAQRDYLKGLNTARFYLVGGTSAVTSGVQSSLTSYGKITRFNGSNRYDTSKKVADEFFKNSKTMVIVNGDNFPDGITAGPLAAKLNAPVLLVNGSNYSLAKSYASSKNVTKVFVVGGTSAVSSAVANAVA